MSDVAIRSAPHCGTCACATAARIERALRLAAQGLPTEVIAARMGVTRRSVQRYLRARR